MKKNILFLSIFFSLSLGAMEERAVATDSVVDESTINSWNDFNPDNFDFDYKANRFPNRFLLENRPGRISLLARIAESIIIADQLATELSGKSTSVISGKGVNFVRNNYAPICPGNPVTIISKALARLELFLTETNDIPIDEKRLFEPTRRNYLILLKQIIENDPLPDTLLQDMPDYVEPTHNQWPPKHTKKGVFSPLSSFAVIQAARKKRSKTTIDESDYEYTFFCSKKLIAAAADAKTE